MDLLVDVTGIDMNNSVNLAFYTQLIRFHENASATETCLHFPDNAQQRMIQSWAHELDCAFEFTLATQAAKVVRKIPPAVSTGFNTENLEFLGFNGVSDIGLDSSWPTGPDTLSDLIQMNAGPSFDAVEAVDTQLQPIQTDDFHHADIFSVLPKRIEPTIEEPNVQPLFADSTELVSSQPCCTHAYSLEHTVITALSTLNHDITGTREDCSYISSRKSRNKAGGLLGNASDRHSVCDNRLSIDSSSSGGLPFEPEVEASTNTLKGCDPEPKVATPTRVRSDRSELNQSRSDGVQGRQGHPGSVGSASSVKHERGRKRVRDMFNRRPSLQSPASTTFQEYVFDSRSPRIGSPASGASGASGRRGPLDAAANAAAKAVKAIRACWRCKFLRKTCSLDSPCLACPKPPYKSKSIGWPAVACRRGTFSEEMGPLPLCPGSGSQAESSSSNSEASPPEADEANEWSRLQIESREEMLSSSRQAIRLGHLQNPKDFDLAGVRLSSSVPQEIGSQLASSARLNDCIDSVIQEIILFPSSKQVIFKDGETQLAGPVLLLRSAVQYQTSIGSDHLIERSLDCLRSSLEALAVSDSGFLKPTSHRACPKRACRFDCIERLSLDSKQYLKELSRVFFTKENMRSKES
ncbi:hypothetical protein BDZ45DRAFT_72941 [Acephala macrosclerotiorum]|nr:hypothetical protein BDZ45DRAFT_72941 [Acephala macrosclerotiorum]